MVVDLTFDICHIHKSLNNRKVDHILKTYRTLVKAKRDKVLINISFHHKHVYIINLNIKK